jgi:GntR family transcriptional regulator, galactonate operon transcriptional repressor
MAAYEQIVRNLLVEIVGGQFPPGTTLPKFDDLAQAHGRSKGPVREALRALEERGVVHVKHGVAAIVRPESEWDILDREVLTALLDSPKEREVLAEFLEARRLLEIEAAGLAADRADADDVTTLAEIFKNMTELAERARESRAHEPRYQAADVEFHRAIVKAARNRALAKMTEPIHSALETTVPRLARPPARFKRGLPEHKHILSAITDKDRDRAREAMRKHLLTIERYLEEKPG